MASFAPPLPEWAMQFVRRVDARHHHDTGGVHVTAARALAVLRGIP
jgi:hypothetical protein